MTTSNSAYGQSSAARPGIVVPGLGHRLTTRVNTRIRDQPTAVEREQVKASPALKAFAGSIGGLIEAAALQPIDTIKTRMQLNPTKYTGIITTARTTAGEEGVRSLWKGLTPFALHLYSKYALRFGTNAVFQGLLADKDGKVDGGRRMMAGLGSGVVEAIVIVTPFEVVKIRLQNQFGTDKAKLKYSGPLDVVMKIVRHEGLFALWAGAAPTVCRNGINLASMFYSKPLVDDLLWGKKEKDGKTLELYQSMASGFVATVPGMLLTNPLDVCKTRLMAQDRTVGQQALRYTGLLQTMYSIAREEGARRLYKGLAPRLLRVPPGMAITWGVSDQVVQAYERRA